MRIMAIDLGDARTGLAVSDLTCTIAGDTLVINEWDTEKIADRIKREAEARNVDTLVLGKPINMDGSTGPRAEKSMVFAELPKERTGLNVVLWDERRTSVDAHRILHDNGRKMKKHRENVDAVAASLILEGYLASIHK